MESTPFEPPRRWSRRPIAALVAAAALAAGGGAGVALSARSTAATQDVQLASATGYGPTGAAAGAKVTVTGTGTVEGTPDTLALQMGASATASTATGALDQSNAEVAALVAVFRSHGAKRADIQTSGLSLSPSYDANGSVTGYRASDQLTITLHGLARAGGVIDAAAHAVGNGVQIDGITFSIADTSSLLETARIDAVRAAQAEAEAFARAAGATLGPVTSIAGEEQQPQPVVQYAFAAGKAAAGATSPVPVQPGSQQLSVRVRVVYALRG